MQARRASANVRVGVGVANLYLVLKLLPNSQPGLKQITASNGHPVKSRIAVGVPARKSRRGSKADSL